ncbi:hypothetical protein HBI16_188640 [Parastagonospora nodorum]|nr:hypothetical protein HBI16_188640 [Parastagonospora nodorum]
MANQPPNPANANLNINLPPPSLSSNSSAPFTPRSASVADDSDAEFDPTPLQSPRGGPEYDDLPPSYDEAQHQAVSDARNGVTPLDPNQIEAHRLTLNEGPDQPEIWEYRIRGEELDAENEQAPEYGNITNHHETAIPIQHVETSTNIPVGQTGARDLPPDVMPDRTAELLSQALNFARHEPDADAQYAPRLTRRIAIPQQASPGAETNTVQFLRAYAKALHAHSIRPAEFTEFIDGLNSLCVASGITVDDLLSSASTAGATSDIVQNYIRSVNEVFFAPRGLRVSLRSLSALINALAIPTERGQRAGAVAGAADDASTAERRAQSLHPWIEAIETNVPESSTHSLVLREMAERRSAHTKTASSSSQKPELEDPPHSSLEEVTDPNTQPRHEHHSRHASGRGGHHGPHGTHGHGPFGGPGNWPFGGPGLGPFGGPGNGPFGGPGLGPFGHSRRGRGGRGRDSHSPAERGAHRSPRYDRGQAWEHPRRSGPPRPGDDWAQIAKNFGQMGEEFGKRMGDWGEQFGKQASAWGQNVGERANALGAEINARNTAAGSSSSPPPQHDDGLPPSYEAGPSAQESGVLRGDRKASLDPPSYEHVEISTKSIEEAAKNDDDDDSSSISSSSSDSDSDSDPDSDSDDEDTQATFLKRIQSINNAAEASAKKGKKSPSEIAEERALAIEEAQNQKLEADVKIDDKRSRRAMSRTLKQKRRDLKREHKHKKRELKAAHGKGKGKAKKNPAWKMAKKEYKTKRKELRKDRAKARQEWREARSERLRERREARRAVAEQEEEMSKMVWLIVENLDDPVA